MGRIERVAVYRDYDSIPSKNGIINLAELSNMQFKNIPAEELPVNRFQQLDNQLKAREIIKNAINDFEREYQLDVTVYKNHMKPPDLPIEKGYVFGYSSHSLYELMPDVVDLIAIVVNEDHHMIGYGFASRKESNANMEFDLLDVDKYSRRSAGLSKEITIEDQRFGVGVGHLIGLRMFENILPPIFVQAEHEEAQYIFISLGCTERSKGDLEYLQYIE